MENSNHFNVIVIGAGISGIGAGYYLKKNCPNKSFCIIEGRENIGGTWDLFKYPGIRSDSDMFTLGYAFKPWKEQKTIANGPSILNYLEETVEENNLREKIKFSHKVLSANWNSGSQKWEVRAAHHEQEILLTANFLFMGTGYYNYDEGYTPEFNDLDKYEGKLIHPQKWPEDYDYTDRKWL